LELGAVYDHQIEHQNIKTSLTCLWMNLLDFY